MPDMNSNYSDDRWGNIDADIYDWSIKVFRALRKMLSVNVQMDAASQINQGDIFLFNHFSRFETFIPQYMIYEQTGDYCCSIASSEFFVGDTLLANYLKNVGAVPHDHPRLFSLLAGQIIRGRKVIIFPEGGMVKDRRVLDKRGHYSIYSRITGERRKQHTGPAVLAQGLETFKACVRNAYKNKNTALLMHWKNEFEVDNLEQLLMQALKPTLIVPANITFYPIRSTENILHKGVEMLSKGLSLRQTEELLIEGNIIFKDTDMHIRMGKPVAPYHVWHWWNRSLLERCTVGFCSLDDAFDFHADAKTWKQKLFRYYFKKNAAIARNLYMEEMYANVTINLCHLASTLIMHSLEQNQEKIEKQQFHTTLYIAIKLLQKNTAIHLHPGLINPDDYRKLLHGHNERFDQFIHAAEHCGLIVADKNQYFFTPKLREEYDFDAIRMENPIAVYNNETKPIKAVLDAVTTAADMAANAEPAAFADWYFDDETLSLAYDRALYLDAVHDELNKRETAHLDPQPFFLAPQNPNGTGILLVHGLLASPAELRAYGEHL
ncbi:MAG: alpha/beta hydrolase, partial [Methylococcaceae bacterium]